MKELFQRKLQVVLPLLGRSLLARGDCRDTSWVVARLLLTRVARSCGATCRNRGSGSSVSERVSKFGIEVLVLEIVGGLFERWLIVWVGFVSTGRLINASPAAAGTNVGRRPVHRRVSHVFILSSVILADAGVGLECSEGRCATIVEVWAGVVAWGTGRRPASATGIRRTCALRSPPPLVEQGAVCVVDLNKLFGGILLVVQSTVWVPFQRQLLVRCRNFLCRRPFLNPENLKAVHVVDGGHGSGEMRMEW